LFCLFSVSFWGMCRKKEEEGEKREMA